MLLALRKDNLSVVLPRKTPTHNISVSVIQKLQMWNLIPP